LQVLGKAQQLLSRCVRRPVFRPRIIESAQAPEHAEELEVIVFLLTQLARPHVGYFHFWRSVALGRHQATAQDNLERQFLLRAFSALRE
jgi:hypothetical protein